MIHLIRKTVAWFVLIVILTAASSAAETIRWQPHDAAIQTAERENMDVFIQFKAEWCLYCKLMERETFQDKTLAQYLNRNYVTTKVDLDEKPSIARQYGINRVPATVLIRSGEKPRVRIGFLSAKQLLYLLENQNGI